MAETGSTSYIKGLSVLAVDDEKDILDTIEDVLDVVRHCRSPRPGPPSLRNEV